MYNDHGGFKNTLGTCVYSLNNTGLIGDSTLWAGKYGKFINKHCLHSCEIFVFHCCTTNDLIYMFWPERFMKMKWRYSRRSTVTYDFFVLVDVDLILLICSAVRQLSAVIHLQAGSRLAHSNGLIHLSKKRVAEFIFLNELLIGWWQQQGRWGIMGRVTHSERQGVGTELKVVTGQTCSSGNSCRESLCWSSKATVVMVRAETSQSVCLLWTTKVRICLFPEHLVFFKNAQSHICCMLTFCIYHPSSRMYWKTSCTGTRRGKSFLCGN